MMSAGNLSNEARSIFVTGLKNAHAMESQALSIMTPQVKRIENYPEMAQRLEQHCRETEGQIDRLESILSGMGEDKSSLKDTAMSLAGGMAAISHSMASDEIVKNSLANFAFENYEIAAYRSLITLAEAAELDEARGLLEANLSEEVAMANWIDDHLADVTLQYASLREMGEQAKH